VETVCCAMLVPVLVRVTSAPGTTDDAESVTVPVTCPTVNCACMARGSRALTMTPSARRRHIDLDNVFFGLPICYLLKSVEMRLEHGEHSALVGSCRL